MDCPNELHPRIKENGHGKNGKTNVVLLAGGCFNPPHFGHLRMIKNACDFLEREFHAKVTEVIVSPVADKYRSRKPSLIEARHRIAMCQRLFNNSKVEGISVNHWEADRNEWTAIIEVLKYHQKELDKRHSKAKLMLLCGGDLLIEFLTNPEWHSEELPQILDQFGIVCGTRGTNVRQILAEKPELEPFLDELHMFEEDPNQQKLMSSTEIRRATRDGKPIGGFTSDSVVEYIQGQGLYMEKEDSNGEK